MPKKNTSKNTTKKSRRKASKRKRTSMVKKSNNWWDQTSGTTDVKWSTLSHSGPLFPPPYVPLPANIKILYNGKPISLDKTNIKNAFNVSAEEAAMFYAQSLETNDRVLADSTKQKGEDIRKDKVFNNNFFRDWKKIMGKSGKSITKLANVDFSPFIKYIVKKRDVVKEEKKQMTPLEKKLDKLRKNEIKSIFSFATIDGVRLPATTNMQPPSIFKGHKDSDKRGKIKARIVPSDITLNISRNSVPLCFINGTQKKWGKIISDKTAVWLAKWKNPITGSADYNRISRSHDPWVGRNDLTKFQKARHLNNKITHIRAVYMKDLTRNPEMALAVFLLDELAIRPGTEKGGSSGTLGLTTLKCENFKFKGGNKIELSFIGKSSIPFSKKITLKRKDVYTQLKNLCNGKSKKDMIFPKLTASTLNAYLGKLLKGLTAKVFRTWKASSEVHKELQLQNAKIKKGDDATKKLLLFVTANINAAITLNHKRMTDNTQKIQKIKDNIKLFKDKKTNTAKQKLAKDNKISKEQLKLLEAENNVNMGTSKANYIDPRIIVSWAKHNDMPIESIYKTENDRTHFIWAMETPSTFDFTRL